MKPLDLKSLLESVKTQMSTLQEANAEMMGSAQRQRYNQSLANMHTMGMEVEFYSSKTISDTQRYIQNELGYTLWNAEADGSLDDEYGGDDDRSSRFTRDSDLGEVLTALLDYKDIDALDQWLSILGDSPTDIYGMYLNVYNNVVKPVIEYSQTTTTPIRNYELLDLIQDENMKKLRAYLNELIQYNSDNQVYADKLLDIVKDASSRNQNWQQYVDQYPEIQYGRGVERDTGEVAYYLFNGNRIKAEDVAMNSKTFKNWVWWKFGNEISSIEGDSGDDGSEVKYGVEIKLNKLVRFSSYPVIIDQVVNILNDPEIRAEYGLDAPNPTDETGLHVHIGLSNEMQYNVLDMFRLLINVAENEGDFEAYGDRPVDGEYRYSMQFAREGLETAIEYIREGNRDTYIDFPLDKFMALNMGNSHRRDKFPTIEFRHAYSGICANKQTFTNYMKFLHEIIAQSYTGSDTMKVPWESDVVLKISNKDENTLRVFDYGKYVGNIHLQFSPLEGKKKNFPSKNEKKYGNRKPRGSFSEIGKYLSRED